MNELSDLVGRDDVLLLGWDPGVGEAGMVRKAIDPHAVDLDTGWRDEAMTPAGTIGVIVGGERRFYLVFEDPSDGYRSYLGGVLMSSEPENAIWFLEGTPRPVHVRTQDWMPYEYSTEGKRPADVIVFADKNIPAAPRKHDGIESDEVTVQDPGGHVWFVVGTDNSDDYYPSFVADWHPYAGPENLTICFDCEVAGRAR